MNSFASRRGNVAKAMIDLQYITSLIGTPENQSPRSSRPVPTEPRQHSPDAERLAAGATSPELDVRV